MLSAGESSDPERKEVEELSLKDQLRNVLEEARVVLPGMQALFGFQMIAAFNEVFFSRLSHQEQVVHLLATGSTTLAIALAVTPTTLHRQSEPNCVSRRLLKRCTSFLTWAMLPLALGITLDFYILSRLVLDDVSNSAAIAITLAAGLALLWFLLPQRDRRKSTCPDP